MPLFNFDDSGDEEEEDEDDAEDMSDEEFDGEMNDADFPYRRSGSASSFAEDFVVTDHLEPNNNEDFQDPDMKDTQSKEFEIATGHEVEHQVHAVQKVKSSNHRHVQQQPQQEERPADGTGVAPESAKKGVNVQP